MIERLKNLLADEKQRDLALLGGAATGLMAGGKLAPLAVFTVAVRNLERRWRKEHPEFTGSLRDRLEVAAEHYDRTHQHPTNRLLHTIGIPMILGGAAGMLVAPRWTPPWWIANGSWTVGWALNFVGHGVFEKGEPAFAQDPLAFVAGPIWDAVRIEQKIASALWRETPSEQVPPTAQA